jgi:hypothetical protein
MMALGGRKVAKVLMKERPHPALCRLYVDKKAENARVGGLIATLLGPAVRQAAPMAVSMVGIWQP